MSVILFCLYLEALRSADLLALLYVPLSYAFFTFSRCVLVQVRHLIALIPDTCLLSYFDTKTFMLINMPLTLLYEKKKHGSIKYNVLTIIGTFVHRLMGADPFPENITVEVCISFNIS